MNPDASGQPVRLYHARVVAFVVGLFTTCIVLVDLLFDGALSWWTLVEILGASALTLGYLYLVRFPKLRGK